MVNSSHQNLNFSNYLGEDMSLLMAPIQGRCQKIILPGPTDTEIGEILHDLICVENLAELVDLEYQEHALDTLIHDIVRSSLS